MTLDIISDPLLAPTQHGFFGRKGGASSGIFAGLNCGAGSSDLKEIVSINRARVAEAMGVAPANLVTVHQTHSATAIVVDGPLNAPVEADGIVTNSPDIAIAILTADCQPVLFHDPEAGVVGAAHAGWKGAVGGILDATLDAMEKIGAQRANTRALIGPTISQRAYEVGPEFYDDFIAEDTENARFFAQGEGDRLMFDLPSYGLHRLRSAGVGEAQWTGHCTYSDPDRFYSFRRTCHAGEADYGRLISAIRL